MSGAVVDESDFLLDTEQAPHTLKRRLSRRHVLTVVTLGVLAIVACGLWSGVGALGKSHGVGEVTQLDEEDCIEVPDECSDYMETFHKCDWTSKWACPDAPTPGTKTADGSGGRAHADGSLGFTCCCAHKLWTTAASSKPLCSEQPAAETTPTPEAVSEAAATVLSSAGTADAATAATAAATDAAPALADMPTTVENSIADMPKATASSTDCTIGTVGVGAGVSCMFPFTYEGVVYDSCTSRDNTAAWCYTTVDSNGIGVPGQWGECTHSCAQKEDAAPAVQATPSAVPGVCTTGVAGVGAGHNCTFPFTYDGTSYSECAVKGNTVSWCYTQVDADGKGLNGKWGECSDGPCHGHDVCTTTGTAGVGAGAKCAFPFNYGGKAHEKCTVQDNTVEWCYTDVDDENNGVAGQWGECKASVCNQ